MSLRDGAPVRFRQLHQLAAEKSPRALDVPGLGRLGEGLDEVRVEVTQGRHAPRLGQRVDLVDDRPRGLLVVAEGFLQLWLLAEGALGQHAERPPVAAGPLCPNTAGS